MIFMWECQVCSSSPTERMFPNLVWLPLYYFSSLLVHFSMSPKPKEMSLLTVMESLPTAKVVAQSTVLILLDLSAVFNTLNHQILLSGEELGIFPVQLSAASGSSLSEHSRYLGRGKYPPVTASRQVCRRALFLAPLFPYLYLVISPQVWHLAFPVLSTGWH